MATSSKEAFTGPGVAATSPTGIRGCTCAPMTALTSCRASSADSTKSLAPRGKLSSRGCSRASMATGRSRVRADRASAVRAARCTSWPHACIAPFADAHGTPVRSTIGKASNSARTAMAGPSAGPIRMIRPSATAGASGCPIAAATSAAVGCSYPPVRGSACTFRRRSCAYGNSASSAVVQSAARLTGRTRARRCHAR